MTGLQKIHVYVDIDIDTLNWYSLNVGQKHLAPDDE